MAKIERFGNVVRFVSRAGATWVKRANRVGAGADRTTMVRRWQLALSVLAALVLSVVVLWDRASGSIEQGDRSRVEAIDGDGGTGTPPGELAFAELDEAA
ncbi:MAG: hypothetical protein OER95_20140, partial [Acidimicrobiia bacterium]|nr:hypothetical protein [Acidimicrobiia bacterium]